MFKRRDVLRLAAGGAVAGGVWPAGRAFTQTRDWFPEITGFSSALVVERARVLAKKPFVPPPNEMPTGFGNLSADQYAGIRLKPDAVLWNAEPSGFALEPLPRGFVFTTPMELNIVEDGQSRPLLFNPSLYGFGAIKAAGASAAGVGFSGFRILHRGDDKQLREIALFQGATFFHAVARDQTSGVMARGLAIRTGDPKGEELPIFRAAYIEMPTLAGGVLVAHALLDSPSLTGCCSFTLHPGNPVILDTELTLFPRTAIDHYGLAPMQATFFIGPLDKERVDDVRPDVYETTGLQIANGNGEWLWRPLANRDRLQASAFGGTNPRGFGLLQRTRDFDWFQDDVQHWERRPSLWVEPIDDWGEGILELLEIPTQSEVNDNIIASWRPKAALEANKPAHFAYRQFWCWTPPSRPPFCEVRLSRNGRGSKEGFRRFIVEFVGDVLGDENRSGNVKPTLTIKPGAIVSMQAFLSRATKTCRVVFEIDTRGEPFNELRLILESNDKPISETWLFRCTT